MMTMSIGGLTNFINAVLEKILRVSDTEENRRKAQEGAANNWLSQVLAFQNDSNLEVVQLIFSYPPGYSKVRGGCRHVDNDARIVDFHKRSVIDVSSTLNLHDCATRALGYLWRKKKYGELRSWVKKNIAERKPDGSYPPLSQTPRQLAAMYYVKNHDPELAEIPSDVRLRRFVTKGLSIDKYTSAGCERAAQDSEYLCKAFDDEQVSAGLVGCSLDELVQLCRERFLGAHARIMVFGFAKAPNNQPVLLHTTPDVRDYSNEPGDINASDYIGKLPHERNTEWYTLVLSNGHYYAVNSIPGLKRLRNGYNCQKSRTKHKFCLKDGCKKFYTHDEAHWCVQKCKLCCEYNCGDESLDSVLCNDCGRRFLGDGCYTNHKRIPTTGLNKNKSVCSMFYYCGNEIKCTESLLKSRDFGARSEHKCGGGKICRTCKTLGAHGKPHTCIIKGVRNRFKDASPTDELYYWDCETYTDKVTKKVVCEWVEVQTSSGEVVLACESIREFCEFALGDFESRENACTFVAHNSRGFDSHLVNEYVMNNLNLPTEQIKNGNKLTYMIFSKYSDKGSLNHDTCIRFIDSANFLMMPLSKFTKTFGLVAKKGYWPYSMCDGTPEVQSYVGPIPPVKNYNIKSMNQKTFDDFYAWYVVQIRKTNNFDPEAHVARTLRYIQDINPSYQWEESEESFGTEYVGAWCYKDLLAEYCHDDVTLLRLGCEQFRSMFLNMFPEDELKGIDPFEGVTISSACRKMFMGKFYNQQMRLAKHTTADDKWLRKGFHGGRTEAFQLYANMDVNNGEQLKYVDVTSLYPFINSRGWYPTGIPIDFTSIEQLKGILDGSKDIGLTAEEEIYLQRQTRAVGGTLDDLVPWLIAHDFDQADTRIGTPRHCMCMIECDFEPPDNLHVPVLPSKDPDTGKLVFSLKNIKGAVKSSTELHQALEHGYNITNMKRVMMWPRKICTQGFFKDYTRAFLTKKYEASGWRGEDDTEEKKRAYIDDLNNHDELSVKYENVAHNPGMRALTKLCINNPWGKWCQRGDQWMTDIFYTECKYDVAEHQRYWNLISDNQKERSSHLIANGNAVLVRYREKEQHREAMDKVNVTIGVFTTAQARTMMYRHITEVAPEQLCYMDTDSMVYKSSPNRRGWSEIRLGGFLGDFESEIADDRIMAEGTFAGPKNYGYVTVDRENPADVSKWKSKLKIKGFRLGGGFLDPFSVANTLTYDSIREMLIRESLIDRSPALVNTLLDNALKIPSNIDGLGEDMIRVYKERRAMFIEKGSFALNVFRIMANRSSELNINPDTKRSYNYVFDKRLVPDTQDWRGCIRTNPLVDYDEEPAGEFAEEHEEAPHAWDDSDNDAMDCYLTPPSPKRRRVQ